MNREIRFRAKDKHGDWQYGHVALVNFYGDFHCWKMFNTDQGKEGIAVDPKTIDQSTGLKDKNGVEIFEGDILFHKLQGKCVVYYPFNESTASFGLKRVVNGFKNTLQDADRLYEVIGNIHENPELMGEAENE